MHSLPVSQDIDNANELLKRRFWGKVEVSDVYGFMRYLKGNIAQKILYEIKYNNNPDLAYDMGSLFGSFIAGRPASVVYDLIVPIPLHQKKLKMRGYNQSALIAEGMSHRLQIPHDNGILYRSAARSTQTSKSRLERWWNVNDTYKVADGVILEGKHILLVDDVITTGATFEVTARCLLGQGAGKVSIAALAYAI